MLWYGSIETIPSGWHLCDGTMGTPDLRDRFIVAAGNTYSPGQQGGSTGHYHSFSGSGHAHSLKSGTSIQNVYPNGYFDHNTTLTPVSGVTGAAFHIPQYHALCYIMKL
jgi:hypothetical protein